MGRAIAAKILPVRWQSLATWAGARWSPLVFERTERYLARRFRDARLRAILAAQWGDYGVPPSGSAFGFHALIAVMHYADGAVYPVGGSETLTEAIVDAIRERGSEVRTGCRALEIVVENGRAAGVRAVDRRTQEEFRLRAPVVISDAGSVNTYGRLLSAPLRGAFASELAALPRNPSGLVLFVGLDRSPADLGAEGGNHWVFPSWDHESLVSAAPGEGLLYVSFPSLKNPAADQHTVEVVTIASPRDFAAWRGEPWPRIQSDYGAFKAKVAERMLERLEAHLPGFRGATVFSELATPLTFATFQASVDGAFYGLACSPERLHSPLAAARGPIAGLFLAGQDAATPGVQGAMVGGLMAATAALPSWQRLSLWRRLRQTPAPRETFDGHLRVAAIWPESPTVKTFVLEALDGRDLPFRPRAGQFLNVEIPAAAGTIVRSYSISSAPRSSTCEITVKRQVGGQGSVYLHDQVAVGRALRVKGPFGHFTAGSGDTARVLVGGGVGLTPVMSMVRQWATDEASVPVVLISAQRSDSELLFHRELLALAKARGNFTYLPVVEETTTDPAIFAGRIDAQVCSRALEGLVSPKVYLCGPPPMMDAVRAHLLNNGHPAEAVVTESFTPAESQAALDAGAEAEVEFHLSGRRVRASKGQTLLGLAQAEGIALKSACGVGQCGACRVRVVKGETASADPSLLSPEEQHQGFVLACQTTPLTDLVLEA